jgi:hypothetical protein
MSEKRERCKVCGKALEAGQSICQPCQESIRAEATGKGRKLADAAEKEMRKHGQKPPKK